MYIFEHVQVLEHVVKMFEWPETCFYRVSLLILANRGQPRGLFTVKYILIW